MIGILQKFFSSKISSQDFERAVFDVVTRRILDKNVVQRELDQVNNMRLSGRDTPENHENRMAHHYLALEEYLVTRQPESQISREGLRLYIFSKCHADRVDGMLPLLFLPEHARRVRLFHIFVATLFRRVRKAIGDDACQQVIASLAEASSNLPGAVHDGDFDWPAIENGIYGPSAGERVAVIQGFLHEAVKLIIQQLMAIMDATRTDLLIRDTYNDIQKHLDFLEDVSSMLLIVPEGFMPEERVSLLGKEELEQELKSKSEQLEITSSRLHAEEERLSSLTREELEKRVRERTAELLKALEDVKRSRDQLEEFSSLATHELRTPTGIIKGYASLLLDGSVGHMTDKQKTFVNHIKEADERLLELINAMLNASRIELGTLAIEPEDVYLRDLAEKVVTELTPQIDAKHLKMRTDFDYKLPMLHVDPRLMRAIFQNLLSNSVKYTPEGGTIGFSIRKEDPFALIAVQDSGYGIPKEQQGKIFSKLFRADNVRTKQIEGTGLGLYIVKSVVEQAGGKIWFESPPPTPLPDVQSETPGTVFYAQIPLEGMKRKEGIRGLS